MTNVQISIHESCVRPCADQRAWLVCL